MLKLPRLRNTELDYGSQHLEFLGVAILVGQSVNDVHTAGQDVLTVEG